MPGLALRERGVSQEQGDFGWRPGFAHRERGVGAQHWLVSYKLDTHHLSGPGCPTWAPGTDVSNSGLQILDDNTTLGAELRLPPVLISCFLTSVEFEDICTSAPRFLGSLEFGEIWLNFSALSRCPGDGELVENLTLVGYAPSPAQIGKWMGGRRTSRLGLRKFSGSALSDLFLRSARPFLVRETTANFTFWTFVQQLGIRDSRRRDETFTGSYVTNCIFGLKKVLPAYGFDIEKLVLSFLDFPVPFFGSPVVTFGWTDVRESGSCESVRPFVFQIDIVDCVDNQHVKTSRNSPVVPGAWRRARWSKRKGIATSFVGLGPSVGGAFGSVGCRDPQDRDVGEASRHADSDVHADVLADEEGDGSDWCHQSINIGHSTHQRRGCLATVSLVVSSSLSSCSSVCPPPVRPAPGLSSFPPCIFPLPPAHHAHFSVAGARACSFAGDGHLTRPVSAGVCPCPFAGGGHLTRHSFAGASVARPSRPVLFVPFVVSCSFISSRKSLYPTGQCGSPLQGVAPIRRSVSFGQSGCCNASTKGGCDVAAASVIEPSVAPTQSSNKFILNRKVTIVDFGLVSQCVVDKVDVDCSVVGKAFGRQPQKLPSSLHYVLRLRGGGSTAASLSGDSVDEDGDVIANEAAGSGIRDSRSLLHNDGGNAVGPSSAGVPAKEEGHMSSCGSGHAFPVFIEEYRLQRRVEFVYSPVVVGLCPSSPKFESMLNIAPPVAPGNASSASGASSSSQGGNQGQAGVVDGRALNAQGNNGMDAGDSEKELTVKERRGQWKNERKEYFDRLNQLRSQVQSSSSSSEPVARRLSFTPSPVSMKGSVELRLIDGRWLSPEPVCQDWSGWNKLSVHRPVVSCAFSVSVGPPSVGREPDDVTVGEDDDGWCPGRSLDDLNHGFDDILVQCYGYPPQ